MQFACWIAEERLELLPCVFRLNNVYRFYDNVGVRVNRSPPRGRLSFNKFQCRTVTGDIDVQPKSPYSLVVLRSDDGLLGKQCYQIVYGINESACIRSSK